MTTPITLLAMASRTASAITGPQETPGLEEMDLLLDVAQLPESGRLWLTLLEIDETTRQFKTVLNAQYPGMAPGLFRVCVRSPGIERVFMSPSTERWFQAFLVTLPFRWVVMLGTETAELYACSLSYEPLGATGEESTP